MINEPLFPVASDDVDAQLDAVEIELYRLDSTGEQVAEVLRDTLDQLYDGQRTGRWKYDQLHKTEKTYMGTLVEINLHRQFGFADGNATDYRIAGIEVDCKYSMTYGGWELPPEAINHLCLLITAHDETSSWSAGLIRVREEYLRDRRTQHGQAKTNELFRTVQRRIIRRAEVATVAQQDDFMKRARGNGGARTALRAEGILVLGHQDNDPLVAAALGLSVPRKGEFVSARVVSAREDRMDPAAVIDGRPWALARPGDLPTPAPVIPRKSPDQIIF